MIYNEDMTTEATDVDLEHGYIDIRTKTEHHDAVPHVDGVWHYETITEYPNGSRDVRRVCDVEPVEGKDAWDEEQTVEVYIRYTDEEYANVVADRIRSRRDMECFPIINRGSLWYSRLSDEQLDELDSWYQSWLDAPQTLVVPTKPTWLE